MKSLSRSWLARSRMGRCSKLAVGMPQHRTSTYDRTMSRLYKFEPKEIREDLRQALHTCEANSFT